MMWPFHESDMSVSVNVRDSDGSAAGNSSDLDENEFNEEDLAVNTTVKSMKGASSYRVVSMPVTNG